MQAAPAEAPAAKNTVTEPSRLSPGRLGLLLALIGFGVALAWVRPQFLTVGNLVNVARQISLNGILAVGVTYVLLTGGVDLSLGSVVALSGVLAARFAHPGDWPAMVPIG